MGYKIDIDVVKKNVRDCGLTAVFSFENGDAEFIEEYCADEMKYLRDETVDNIVENILVMAVKAANKIKLTDIKHAELLVSKQIDDYYVMATIYKD